MGYRTRSEEQIAPRDQSVESATGPCCLSFPISHPTVASAVSWRIRLSERRVWYVWWSSVVVVVV